ncbi:hypothetical protein BaRGS_00011420 [Batillaria attramentaria]|uniref:C-type lectin domain-containing protein n=1 Tax=Batillaria attramentaria TaxID=370345 RepID=A0ABD0LDH0_9CAEN
MDRQTLSPSGYRWVDDCSSLDQSSWVGWKSGEPGNTDEHLCAAAYKESFEWGTFKCDSPLQFLCQKPRTACDNVDLGYDAANTIYRSPCFSFQFNMTDMPDDKGPAIPEVWCPADNVPSSAADFVMFSEKGWNPARQHCESMGMTLATLDQAATDFLLGLELLDLYTEWNTDFWLGLFDARILDKTQSPSGYRWVDDCSSLDQSPWAGWKSGEPGNTDEHLCAAAYKESFEWGTFKCDSPLQFLCQKPKTACHNVDLGYDAGNKTYRSPCFSFQFNTTDMPDDEGPAIPEVWCPADNVPSSAADFVMFSDQAKKGWNPARQHCESMGMTLATLDQPAAAYLASLRLLDWYTEAGETDFWIGLWDARILDHSQSGYRWVDDCSSLANGSWMGWESEEPLNTDDHFCVGANMNTGEWKTFVCDSALQFLCRKPKAACDNVDLGYDAVNKIHRSPCFSFQFNLAAMADDTGSTTPEGVSCPGMYVPAPLSEHGPIVV